MDTPLISFIIPFYGEASRDLLRRWKKPGDEKITDIPAFQNNYDSNTQELPLQYEIKTKHEMWDQSDVRVVDASFFRCNNIGFSWNAEQGLLSKLRLKNLSLSCSVSNIFVIASNKFQGFDPELENSVNPKTYSFGVSVGF